MLTLQFEDVPVLIDDSILFKLSRVAQDGDAPRSQCYHVKTRVSDEVRLAFFESLFGGDSSVPASEDEVF